MIGWDFDAVLAAAKAGDEEAFRLLWEDLHPRLLRYLRVLVPSASEDLAAEAWLEIVRGLGRFTGDERRFHAWIFTIGRNRAIDWHRRAARRPAQPLPAELLDHAAEPLAGGATSEDPADAALEAIASRAAVALIATLPPDQAEVIMLRVVAGLDVAEVARMLGKRPGTVRVLAHRGLRRLAERLPVTVKRRNAV